MTLNDFKNVGHHFWHHHGRYHHHDTIFVIIVNVFIIIVVIIVIIMIIIRDKSNYRGIVVYNSCFISTTLSFSYQSAKNKVLNIESARPRA